MIIIRAASSQSYIDIFFIEQVSIKDAIVYVLFKLAVCLWNWIESFQNCKIVVNSIRVINPEQGNTYWRFRLILPSESWDMIVCSQD